MLSGSELWLLRLMADRGRALLDADTMLIVIEESGELRVAASAGSGTVRVRIVPLLGTALGELHRAGRPVALDRPRGPEAAWLHELGLEARGALSEPLPMQELGSGLVVALRTDGSFRDPDKRALAAFAESVARRLAVERSVEVERLRHGMQARERERTRWAREIHDETVQGLGALRLKLASAHEQKDERALGEAVQEVLEGLGREIEGLRHMITELRPAALDDLGLEAAVQALTRRAQAIDELEVHTEFDLQTATGDGRLDAELESTIYRIVQEALTNVSKHAKASSATVVVRADGRIVTALVSDDGEGMSPEAGRARSPEEELQGGFGTSGMRERAELVGGELSFESRRGEGTTVRLTVPLASRPALAAPAY
ncbi:MAG: sensor histidine kinase [Solirubrobacteraceae bacterium]